MSKEKGFLEDLIGIGDASQFAPTIDANSSYVVKMAPDEFWSDDPEKLGYVPVVFGGSIYQALPVSAQFCPLSSDFARKYRDKLGVVIQFIGSDLARIVYTGFVFWKDRMPFGVLDDFPYQNILYFDEKLVILRDKRNDKVTLLMNPFDDDGNYTGTSRGFSIVLDNTEDSEKAIVTFQKGSREGHTLLMDNTKDREKLSLVFKNSSKEVRVDFDDNGAVITTPDVVTLHADDHVEIVSPKISLGSQGQSAKSVVLGEDLVQVLEFILDIALNHKHPAMGGLTGPTLPPEATNITQKKSQLNVILSQRNTTE